MPANADSGGHPWCFALDDTCRRRCGDDCLYMVDLGQIVPAKDATELGWRSIEAHQRDTFGTPPAFDDRPVHTDDPRFEPIWQAIKRWDIQRNPGAGYAGATGTDVQIILDALDGTSPPPKP